MENQDELYYLVKNQISQFIGWRNVLRSFLPAKLIRNTENFGKIAKLASLSEPSFVGMCIETSMYLYERVKSLEHYDTVVDQAFVSAIHEAPQEKRLNEKDVNSARRLLKIIGRVLEDLQEESYASH